MLNTENNYVRKDDNQGLYTNETLYPGRVLYEVTIDGRMDADSAYEKTINDDPDGSATSTNGMQKSG